MSVDLRTRYPGLELRSPLVASPSPLTGELEGLVRLGRGRGGGAAVAVRGAAHPRPAGAGPAAGDDRRPHRRAQSYFPDLADYNTGPWSYLDHITQAKRALSVPVIASLNGITPGGWVGHAKRMRDAGADALELNLYSVATDPRVGAAELEARYLDLVADVRSAISIPWRSS